MSIRRFSILILAASSLRVAVPSAHAQRSGQKITACALLSADEIRRVGGRNDLATAPGHPEELKGHSNCTRSGGVDIGVTIESPTTKAMFDRMRDRYSKAPARSGYRVEHVSGLGDDAYFVIDNSRVQLVCLVGSDELTISLAKISMLPGEMPPEAEAKALALRLAKAGVAKLR